MTEPFAPWSAESAIRAHAVAVCLRDASAGGLRPLESYLPRFRGHEQTIRDEHGRISRTGGSAPAPTERAAPTPLAIGDYEIVAEIGRGSQGIVYRANDRDGNPVAIKVLRHPVTEDRAALRRFRREVRIAQRLSHPAICPVLRTGVTGGSPYLVMRFIAGTRLADEALRLRARRTVFATWKEWAAHARAVAAQLAPIAAALHEAHELGIVHRDVSPGNILLDHDGRPFLVDFGLALLLDEQHSRVTDAGARMGTPAYAAPELRTGHAASADRRADVFSLGAILMELAVQRVPADLDRSGLRSAPVARAGGTPPSEWRDFRALCARATAPAREERYPTAAALGADLEAFARGLRPAARRNPLRRAAAFARSEPLVSGLVGALILVLAVATLGSWHLATSARDEATHARTERRRADAHRARESITVAALQLFATHQPAEALRRLAEVPAEYRGFEGQLLEYLADSALLRAPGPAAGVVFATPEGPRWCGPEGQSVRLTPDAPGTDDVPPLAEARLLAAGRLPAGGWFRVTVTGDAPAGATVRADSFRDSTCLRSLTLRAPQADQRVWTMTDPETAWAADGAGNVVRLRGSDVAPPCAPRGDLAWQLLVCGPAVLAATATPDTYGAVWRWYRASDAVLVGATQDQDGGLVACAADPEGTRVYAVRAATLARAAARLDVLDPGSQRLVAQQGLPGCGTASTLAVDARAVVWIGSDTGKLWRVEPGNATPVTSCFGGTAPIQAVVPGPGNLVLARDASGGCHWWDASGAAGARLWNGHETSSRLWFRDADHVVTASRAPHLLELDLNARSPAPTARIGSHDQLAVTPSGTPWWLAAGRVHELRGDGTVVDHALPATVPPAVFVLPHPTGPYVVTQTGDASDRHALQLHPLRDPAGHVRVFHGLDGPLVQIDADAAGGVLAARGGSSVVVWSIDTPDRPLVRLSAQELAEFAVAPDGTRVAAAYRSHRLVVARLDGSATQETQLGSAAMSVAWSPDSTRCATGNDDDSVVLWDPADLAPVLRFDGLDFTPTLLAWSPDGARLVAAAAAGRIQVWETAAVRTRVLAAARTPAIAAPPPPPTPPQVLLRSTTARFTRPKGSIPRVDDALPALASAPLMEPLWYQLVAEAARTQRDAEPDSARPRAALIAAQARSGRCEGLAELLSPLLERLARGQIRNPVAPEVRGTALLVAGCGGAPVAMPIAADCPAALTEEFALRAALPGLGAALDTLHGRPGLVGLDGASDDPLLADPRLGPALRTLVGQRAAHADAAALLAWAIAVCPDRPPEELAAARTWARMARNSPVAPWPLLDAALRLRQGDLTGIDVLRRLDADQLAGAPRFDAVACGLRALAEAAAGDPAAAQFAALRLKTAVESLHGSEDPVVASLARETARLLPGR